MNFASIDNENNGNYLKLLSIVSKLSALFSDSSIPYIHYRIIENIFCKCFNASNLSRSDTAFDAKYNSIGIGLKTFICNSNNSSEKIAEFNQLSKDIQNFRGQKLAEKLAEYRNARIELANRTYGISESLYHIVARQEKKLILFETDYRPINVDNIRIVKGNDKSLHFEDGQNIYSYNHSKSTLFRKFTIPQNHYLLDIEIIQDPYNLLLGLFEDRILQPANNTLTKGIDYVILPLYSTKKRIVCPKSVLNQWNAAGRKRNVGEVYIPIPTIIHRKYPDFFPNRDASFNLKVPTNEILSAKLCQDNRKALMTNPNRALSDWLLRKVLQLAEGELATIEKLDILGFDSVIIQKHDNENFSIDIMKTNSYNNFIQSDLPY